MNHRTFASLIASASVLLLAASAPIAVKPADTDPFAVVRGMTITCAGAGRVWGTDAMVQTMAELKGLGVNWVTIHPYAGIRPDGTVGGSRIDGMYADTTWLTRPIAEAKRLGLKIMIKPHIAYWGSPFAWRGAIEFETDQQWHRFFDTYEAWITRVAEICKDADAFVVGTELDKTIHHEQQWRRIIASVRTRINAPLTYSANWDRFEEVPFWDALDVIGIQAYFPLVRHDRLPSSGELDTAWSRLIRRLDAYGEKHDRKILLAELGYNLASHAAQRPWDHHRGGDDAQKTQRLCMEAALSALDESDRVVGAFLWKWFPGRPHHSSYLMSTPAMRQVIGEHWATMASPSGPSR